MTLNEIHADQELGITERQIFLWLNDNFPKDKEFFITHANIGKAVSRHANNISIHMSKLANKGYITKIKHPENSNKRNSYIIAR